ncbi:MAG: hypothetical protein HZB83_00860, partial [Deltaproteobacteria bacterium]|nr:hypothetical protein [Deltaproteobacteria bacterium]
MRLEVFPVSHKGYLLARRLSPGFTGALIHSPKGLRKHGLARKVKRAFLSSDGLIFISAAGIAVRTIAPFLRGKHLDPAVVVMDEAGRFAVSLVSGHLGGANELARNLAAFIGATPVITTATDSWGLPCAEDIVKRFGLAIEDVKKIKPVNSAILKGGPVLIIDAEARRLKDIRGYLGGKDNGIFSFSRILPAAPQAKACVFITSRAWTGLKRPMNDKTLILRPREFTAGVGCMRGASSKEI